MTAMRVGILHDMSEGPPAPADLARWLRLGADELRQAGRLERELELVDAWGLGLPAGTAAAVERAFAALVREDVLLIVGPAIGDNALVATPLASRERVPTLNWAGTEHARGEWMFHLQVGSHEDESIVLARHLASAGAARLGVVYDESPIGRRYLAFLRAEAARVGVEIRATASLPPLAEQAAAEVEQVLGGGADALVYLGLGVSAPAVARAAQERGFAGACAMNTAGMRGYHEMELAARIDGWTYVDMISDHNPTLAALRRRLGVDPAEGFFPAAAYDLGRLVAEALARAPELTREGVKQGLEQVKWLPAAQGHAGTLLGFGRYDRGALHGRYLVLRRWAGGRSIEVEARASSAAS